MYVIQAGVIFVKNPWSLAPLKGAIRSGTLKEMRKAFEEWIDGAKKACADKDNALFLSESFAEVLKRQSVCYSYSFAR